jgi:Rad3-related DNA helicase
MRDWFLGDDKERSKTILIIDEAHNFLEEISENPYITFAYNPLKISYESFNDDSSHIYHLKEIAEATQQEEAKIMEQKYYKDLSKIQNTHSERLFNIDDYDFADGGFITLFTNLQFSLSHFFNILHQLIVDQMMQSPPYKIWSMQANKDFTEHINKRLMENGFPDINSIYNQISDEIKNIKSIKNKSNKFPIYYAYHIADSLMKLNEKPYEFAIRKKPHQQSNKGDNEQKMDQIDKFEKVDRLEIFSIHPKKRIEEIISNFHSSIFTSATLSPVEKVSLLLGFDQSLCQKMTSPFPEKNYRCYALAGVHSGSKEFTQEKGFRFDIFEKEILLCVIDDILNYTNRNTGIFVSSKKILEELYWVINKLCKHRNRYILLGNDDNILGDPKDDYDILVDIYSNNGNNLEGKDYRGVENKIAVYKGIGNLLGKKKIKKGAILIDIIGGKFAEGLNYEGNEMEIGILVGLPFKSFEENERLYKAKSDFFFMLEGDRGLADNLAFRYDAFRKIAQTAGRIHRSKKDKGVVIFIDERLLGIKKTIEIKKKRGEWGYSFLSRKNVNEEWKIIQKQLKNQKRIVFPDEKSIREKRFLFSKWGITSQIKYENKFFYFNESLKTHLTTIESKPPINNKEMIRDIQNFFEER